jgi:hypothetical protein
LRVLQSTERLSLVHGFCEEPAMIPSLWSWNLVVFLESQPIMACHMSFSLRIYWFFFLIFKIQLIEVKLNLS